MENKYLLWVKINAPLISISGLDRHIGLPYGCLQRYVSTGEFPEKHLPLLKEKLEPICGLEPNWVLVYVAQLLADRQMLVDQVNGRIANGPDEEEVLADPAEQTARQERSPHQSAIANAKQEQILDDLVRLYSVIRIESPGIAAAVKEVVQARDPLLQHVFDYMAEGQEPVTLEEIRQLPIRPGRKSAAI